MFVRAYLRASTKEQDARRAKEDLRRFVKERGLRIAAYYTENESGASLKRPELFKLLEDSHPGDLLLIEQVDRLSRLGAEDEETFRQLVELVNSLDEEQKRATREGLGEDELALFDLLQKDGLDKTTRERVKQASRELLTSIKARLAELDRFWEKDQTKADVEVFILDQVFTNLPTPPFTPDEKRRAAERVYAQVWQQAMTGDFATVA
jgi:hypothetical protein